MANKQYLVFYVACKTEIKIKCKCSFEEIRQKKNYIYTENCTFIKY